jgi:hypothetical protein
MWWVTTTQNGSDFAAEMDRRLTWIRK